MKILQLAVIAVFALGAPLAFAKSPSSTQSRATSSGKGSSPQSGSRSAPSQRQQSQPSQPQQSRPAQPAQPSQQRQVQPHQQAKPSQQPPSPAQHAQPRSGTGGVQGAPQRQTSAPPPSSPFETRGRFLGPQQPVQPTQPQTPQWGVVIPSQPRGPDTGIQTTTPQTGRNQQAQPPSESRDRHVAGKQTTQPSGTTQKQNVEPQPVQRVVPPAPSQTDRDRDRDRRDTTTAGRSQSDSQTRDTRRVDPPVADRNRTTQPANPPAKPSDTAGPSQSKTSPAPSGLTALTSDAERRWIATLSTQQRTRVEQHSAAEIQSIKQRGDWARFATAIETKSSYQPSGGSGRADGAQPREQSPSAKPTSDPQTTTPGAQVAGGTAGKTTTQPAKALAYADVLSASDWRWIRVLNLDLQQQVLSLSPQQIHGMQEKGTWSRYKQAITDANSDPNRAQQAYWQAYSKGLVTGLVDGKDGVVAGVGTSLKGTVTTVETFVRDPIGYSQQTIAGMYAVARHPILAGTAMAQSTQQSILELEAAIRTGDSKRAGEITAKFFTDVAQSAVAGAAVAKVTPQLAAVMSKTPGDRTPGTARPDTMEQPGLTRRNDGSQPTNTTSTQHDGKLARPTHAASDANVGRLLNDEEKIKRIRAGFSHPELLSQQAYLHGQKVRGRPEGSVVPDWVLGDTSAEVKNYRIDRGSALVSNIAKQYRQRMQHLPEEMRLNQEIYLDFRGQQVSEADKIYLRNQISYATQGGIPPHDIYFILK